MKRLSLFVFVLFVLLQIPTFLLFAQDFKVDGVVMEKDLKVRIALASVTNKRNGFSVGSNDLGLFTMEIHY
jgi:hypothetical protein